MVYPKKGFRDKQGAGHRLGGGSCRLMVFLILSSVLCECVYVLTADSPFLAGTELRGVVQLWRFRNLRAAFLCHRFPLSQPSIVPCRTRRPLFSEYFTSYKCHTLVLQKQNTLSFQEVCTLTTALGFQSCRTRLVCCDLKCWAQ